MKLLFGFLIFSIGFGPVGMATTMGPDDDDSKTSKVTAPDNMEQVRNTLGGAYFVDKELVRTSKSLQEQLKSVREQIRSGTISSTAAMKELAEIELKLKTVREAIEEQKVLVSAFNVYTRTTEEIFELGFQKLVILTCDRVKIRGWNGAGIKCVLEKMIVAKEPPSDEEFAEIQIIHELGIAESIVGKSIAETEKEEAEYLASEEGQKLNPNQLKFRRELMTEISGSKAKYQPFQGRQCNLLKLKGLDWKEGNQNLSLEVTSRGGGGFHSSQWQRHATLTVYLPECRWTAVRGCLVGVDISGIDSNLLLTTDGSRDRNYEGSFEVTRINGGVVIDQAPIRKLTGIRGNIKFTATNEFVNSGTTHSGGTRTFRPYQTASTEIRNVKGDLTAKFLRTNLTLDKVTGVIDVRNEFGDTTFTLDESLDISVNHRIFSENGRIDLQGGKHLLEKAPVYAFTLCGTLHTNLGRDVLDDKNVSYSIGGQPTRNWHGLVTPNEDRFSPSSMKRATFALENRERTAGLDLISKAGKVTVLGD